MPPAASHTVDDILPSSVFDAYDELLVPLVFQAYADDLVRRLTDLRAGSILEVAAGTGAVTRAMARSLPGDVSITATDLVPGMVDRARRVGTARPVTWDQADVMALPYESESFDVVVCQFGAMFFNPKPDAFAEARRVLRPGGRLLFSVWDDLEHNEFAAAVNHALRRHFPDEPPQFLERAPYGYHDRETIIADLRVGGFDQEPVIERREDVSRASTPVHVAARSAAAPRCATTSTAAVPEPSPTRSPRWPPRSRRGSAPQIPKAGSARSSARSCGSRTASSRSVRAGSSGARRIMPPCPAIERARLDPDHVPGLDAHDADEVRLVARGIATAVAPELGLTDVQADLLGAIASALTGVSVDYRALEPLGREELAGVLAVRRVRLRTFLRNVRPRLFSEFS